MHPIATYSASLEFSCDRRLVRAQFSCQNDSQEGATGQCNHAIRFLLIFISSCHNFIYGFEPSHLISIFSAEGKRN